MKAMEKETITEENKADKRNLLECPKTSSGIQNRWKIMMRKQYRKEKKHRQ